MTIYEINKEIAALLEDLEPDPETGEIVDMDSIAEEMAELVGTREAKLKHCAMAYFEYKAEAEAAKVEKLRLAEKQSRAEKQAERVLKYLDFVGNGEDLDCGIATLKHPAPSLSLEVTDATAAAQWLDRNGYGDFYTVKAPDLCKADVKKLVLSGKDVPGVEVKARERVVLK